MSNKSNAEMREEISVLAQAKGLELPENFVDLKQPQLQELLAKCESAATAPISDATGSQPAVPGSSDGSSQPAAVSTPAEPPPAAPPPPPPPPPPAAAAAPAPQRAARGPARNGKSKRPTLEEYVKAGYTAESYPAAKARWETEDAEAAKEQSADAPPAPPRRKRFVIAKKRSLVGGRGVLGPGAEVTADDFGGDKGLADFVKAGYVVEE